MAPIWQHTDLDRYTGPAALWLLANVYSLIALLQVNNRIKSWEKSTPPPDWKTYRRRWDMHHRWRVVLFTIPFACLIWGSVSK